MISKRVVKYLLGVSGSALFLLMLFAPTAIMTPKYVLLGIFGASLVGQYVVDPVVRFDTETLLIMFFIFVVGVIWSAYGIQQGNPGVRSTLTVHLFYPLVFTLLCVATIQSWKVVYWIQTLLLLASVLILLYTYTYIGYSAGILPETMYIGLNLDQNIGFYDGIVRYTMDNVATLLFLVPYLITAVFLWPGASKYTPPKWVVWVLITLMLPLVILSGRRALQLVLMLSIPLTTAVYFLLPRADRRYLGPQLLQICVKFSIIAAALGLILSLTVIDPIAVIMRFVRGFNPSADYSTSLRVQQFAAMAAGLLDQPFIGYGFGSVVDGIIRSTHYPWAYELMYVKMMYDVGLIGFVPYFIGFVWLCRRLTSLVSTGSILGYLTAPIFVGMMAFVIASASNPYLNKFAYMWVIFVPLGIVHLVSAYRPAASSTPLIRRDDGENR